MGRLRIFGAVVCLAASLCTLVPRPAGARLVSTDEAIAQAEQLQQGESGRARLQAFLARDEVRRELARHGVAPEEARQRVAALSDDEARRLAGHLDDIPAGGDALGLIIGTALLIFIILLITDIAGLTKVFPWTRSVR